MQDDKQVLEQLNVQIGEAETRGDADWLAGIVAPELAFRRANKKIDNRSGFLSGVKRSDPRETRIESVELYGDRAIVKCIVTMKSANGNNDFHNLRLFVRHEGEWKLLGWANEAR